MPKLSVIVSFDVTEPHLQHCLDSLAAQTVALDDVEVLLVPVRHDRDLGAADSVQPPDGDAFEGDNGDSDDLPPGDDGEAAEADAEDSESTVEARDEGLATARAAADGGDLNGAPVTLVAEPVAEHAEARSTGAARTTGEYLLFIEGCDALVGYSLAHLSAALDESGSDLATGNVYRFNELGARQSAAHRKPYSKRRTGVDVRVTAGLLADRVVGNKLWRRSFWAGLPDLGLGDADARLAAARTMIAARTIDVLPAPVLLVRDRESSEALHEIEPMTRRLGAIARIAAGLSGADRMVWDSMALRGDVRQVLLRLDDADDAARERFLDLANAYLDTVGTRLLDGLTVLHRLNHHLVRKRRIEPLLEAITFQKSVELKKAPLVRRGLHYYIRYPFFEDPAAGVPRDVYRLGTELRLRLKTERVEWRDGRLVIGGRVGVRSLRAGRRWQQQVFAFAVNTDTGKRVPVSAKVRRAAEYRLPDVPGAARHDFGGFELTIDPAKLRLAGRWRETEWKLELVVVNRGLVRRRLLANPVAGPPERPPYVEVADDVWVRPSWSADGHLSLAVAPTRARVTGHRMDASGADTALEITGTAAGAATGLRLDRSGGTAALTYPLEVEDARFTARVPVDDLLANAFNEGSGALRQEQWRASLVGADGATAPLVLPDDITLASHAVGDGHHEVVVQRTSTGHLRLRAGWAHPVVRSAEWSGRDLVLAGVYAGASEMSLLFKARGRDESHPVPLERDGDHFRAVFSPAAIPTLSGPLPLAAGSYQLWARVRAERGDADVRAELDAVFVRSLPLAMETPERTFTFTDSGSDVPVLKVGGDLRPEEQGIFAQRRLREETYPALRGEEVLPQILFDSYTGRQFSDSPHSIYAELRSRSGVWSDYPMKWLVRDGQVTLPDDLTRVRYNGRDFYEALARSQYLVTNSRQPGWFARRPDQTVIQTWHGSMLKRIGFDIENIRGKSRDYHDKLAWETRQWDYLVSPSPWATERLRSAFRFEGEILETGYPRNDIFFAQGRDALAERTRERLGLPAGKKVVLYAPTWRDDKYYTRGKHKLDLHLDLRRMYEALGDDHVLLVRRHPRVVDSVPIVGKDFVYDVSLYPEIMELFLITDVLVTDYSSMMFDFANTGRPMLFFTYDIEGYRDNLRGFYFDFEETAPGPLLLTSDDVIGALRGIDDVAEGYKAKYKAFTDQFCPLDDGKAAARVVDRVFGRE
ncbi:CDP-glycerol glycerophosphotransferase [Murinocardiopsis flavida]|uniref:CDP-glycerol glycerophosphotransferase n=1 Tax=Murinocardiopsis flavida TaxID=645275 RepID=A0A2P8D290_9ACTN|nr:CDP-glycerol:glycerophosphate glycerophosphotransferase [Murinocardiopsis flavida]PSK91343.1 CDP-glycerol glycerophosphotransferase [Murinocardiopsis flavida]